MKNIILILLALTINLGAWAISAKEYTEKGHKAQQKLNEPEALKYYMQAIKLNPRNIDALSQASIMCSNIGHRCQNNASRDKYYKAALTYAKLALKIAPNSADANFAMAIYYGRKVYTVTFPKSRIALSAKIKKYAERALRFNPNHYESMTILGMWHYERATLTSTEKKIVSLLGGLPNGSLAQASLYLEKSNGISPNNITTLMALGKVYKEYNKKTQYITVWKKALNLNNQYQDDVIRKQKIKKELAKI